MRTSKNNGSTSSKGRKIKIIKYHQEKIWQHGSDGSDSGDGFNVAMAARVPTKQLQRRQVATAAAATVTVVTAGIAETTTVARTASAMAAMAVASMAPLTTTSAMAW